MLTILLLVAVLVILVAVLLLLLAGHTKTNTRLDEFSRQIGAQTVQGETRIQKLEEIFRGLGKDLRNDVESVRAWVE